jgi:chromatin segregation and condensation protein Rec8/ScpA/Scc1 (kleisin family)
MTSVDEILNEWKQEAENLSLAVKSRNYRSFRNSFSKGCKCFKLIRDMIEKGQTEELKKYGIKIKETMENWQKSAETLPDWMQEISKEVKRVHQKNTNQKKIGNAYNFMKKSGNKLRIKAK